MVFDELARTKLGFDPKSQRESWYDVTKNDIIDFKAGIFERKVRTLSIL